MTPIPLYLLTGYLGAGKTTLLNHLIAHPPLSERRVALLINEFGDLGVDGRLAKKTDAGLYELNSGSLFCACVRSGLVNMLEAIAADARPDLVLAEATGVADTTDLYDVLASPTLLGKYEVKANVCVVDALNFTKVMPFLQAARTQVMCADGLVLNKMDLLDARVACNAVRLPALLRDMNPDAMQTRVERGAVDWAFIEGLSHERRTSSTTDAPPVDVVACSIRRSRAVRERLTAAIDALGEHLPRLKGVVDLGDGPTLVESVFGTYTERPHDGAVDTPGVTAIGWRIAKTDLLAALETTFPPDADA